MLKCTIAFVLGFLVARMIEGNGLSVGGYEVYENQQTKKFVQCNPDKYECGCKFSDTNQDAGPGFCFNTGNHLGYICECESDPKSYPYSYNEDPSM